MTARFTLLNDELGGAAERIRELAVECGRVNVEYRERSFEFDAFDGEDEILAELEKVSAR